MTIGDKSRGAETGRGFKVQRRETRRSQGSIGFVFLFHRLSSPHFWFSLPSLAASYLLSVINFFENDGDHRRSSRAAVHFTADIALVERCERISRLVGRQESGEPCRCAFFIFWSPLSCASFSSDFNIIEAGLMRG